MLVILYSNMDLFKKLMKRRCALLTFVSLCVGNATSSRRKKNNYLLVLAENWSSSLSSSWSPSIIRLRSSSRFCFRAPALWNTRPEQQIRKNHHIPQTASYGSKSPAFCIRLWNGIVRWGHCEMRLWSLPKKIGIGFLISCWWQPFSSPRRPRVFLRWCFLFEISLSKSLDSF
mgnify:CR=1 FL=1